jgi:hypothetical protein
LWLAQMRAFTAAIERMPNARALDAEAFFAAPAPILEAAAGRLGVPMDEEEIGATVAGPLFATYSKNPELPFDNEARLERRARLEAPLAPELAEARRWIEAQGGEGESAAAALDRARLEA